jgi:hypothetical protein
MLGIKQRFEITNGEDKSIRGPEGRTWCFVLHQAPKYSMRNDCCGCTKVSKQPCARASGKQSKYLRICRLCLFTSGRASSSPVDDADDFSEWSKELKEAKETQQNTK